MRNKNLNAHEQREMIICEANNEQREWFTVQSTLRIAKVCFAKLCRLRVFALKDHRTESVGMFLLVV